MKKNIRNFIINQNKTLTNYLSFKALYQGYLNIKYYCFKTFSKKKSAINAISITIKSVTLSLILLSNSSCNSKFNYNFSNKKPEIKKTTSQQLESKPLPIATNYQKKIKVAMFLPFSGKNKELAWSLFNSASLSVFENDINHKIEIIPIDSKENEGDIESSFQEIIDKKIKIVVGPIFNASTSAIEKKAKENGIFIISFSNNPSSIGKMTTNGGIFIAGIMPETQIDKIVNFALDKDKKNFAVIAPNNSYGEMITNYLKKFVQNRDGNFITSEFYENNDKDIDRAVSRVINSFILPDSLTIGKNKVKQNTEITEFDKIYPQIILIPESGKILSKIVSSIKKQNTDERDFQLIGTSQWNELSTTNDINLYGAWIPAPENESFYNFEKNYYYHFNKVPPRISSIAYDLTYAIIEISKNKTDQKIKLSDFTEYSNKSKNGFEGIDGMFRFLPNGIMQRNLAVLQVSNGKFETIEKSSKNFLKY